MDGRRKRSLDSGGKAKSRAGLPVLFGLKIKNPPSSAVIETRYPGMQAASTPAGRPDFCRPARQSLNGVFRAYAPSMYTGGTVSASHTPFSLTRNRWPAPRTDAPDGVGVRREVDVVAVHGAQAPLADAGQCARVRAVEQPRGRRGRFELQIDRNAVPLVGADVVAAQGEALLIASRDDGLDLRAGDVQVQQQRRERHPAARREGQARLVRGVTQQVREASGEGVVGHAPSLRGAEWVGHRPGGAGHPDGRAVRCGS